MNIIAAIPVNGRHPLLKHTISRLLNKCGISKVVCVGEKSDQKVCEDNGAIFKTHANYPLGAKWNYAFKISRDYKPDGILFVGSSDWVEDRWLEYTLPSLEKHEMVGTLGCYLLDIDTEKGMRLVHWPGYGRGVRKDEPIGIGRVISKRALDKMNWKPFDDTKDNSMDWTMWRRVIDNKGTVGILDNIKSMAISTNVWSNKHKFEQHWNNVLRSRKMSVQPFVNDYFPEALNIF